MQSGNTTTSSYKQRQGRRTLPISFRVALTPDPARTACKCLLLPAARSLDQLYAGPCFETAFRGPFPANGMALSGGSISRGDDHLHLNIFVDPFQISGKGNPIPYPLFRVINEA